LSAPPELELGAVVPLERIVARSSNAVIVLPTIRAFRSGCRLDLEVVSRQGALPADEWRHLRRSGLPIEESRSRRGDGLPDSLLRLGVRYASGAKATTVGRGEPADPPAGPMLSWVPGSSGGGRRPGGDFVYDHFGLWLWPLPPAEEFEFAAEWPLGGIALTIVELDGAAVVSAAERSARYWPDAE
jgi:hypothetical protein